MRNEAIASLLVVALIIGIAFGTVLFPRTLTLTSTQTTTHTVTISTTRTITSSSVTNSPAVVEEVIIQPEVINEICIGEFTNSTSTAYLTPVSPNASSIGNQTTTTTTETLRAISTVTTYDNVTMVSGSITCTLINPHYNVTQSSTCPPCV
jgi:hypothetical protein